MANTNIVIPLGYVAITLDEYMDLFCQCQALQDTVRDYHEKFSKVEDLIREEVEKKGIDEIGYCGYVSCRELANAVDVDVKQFKKERVEFLMDFYKVQIDVLKKIGKKNFGNYLFGVWDSEHIALIPDKYHLFIIPKEKFCLDKDVIWGDRELSLTILKSYENDLEDAVCTSVEKIKTDDKYSVVKFESPYGETLVNEKYFKLYEGSGLTYKVASKRSPLFIYEETQLIGLILPIVSTKEG